MCDFPDRKSAIRRVSPDSIFHGREGVCASSVVCLPRRASRSRPVPFSPGGPELEGAPGFWEQIVGFPEGAHRLQTQQTATVVVAVLVEGHRGWVLRWRGSSQGLPRRTPQGRGYCPNWGLSATSVTGSVLDPVAGDRRFSRPRSTRRAFRASRARFCSSLRRAAWTAVSLAGGGMRIRCPRSCGPLPGRYGLRRGRASTSRCASILNQSPVVILHTDASGRCRLGGSHDRGRRGFPASRSGGGGRGGHPPRHRRWCHWSCRGSRLAGYRTASYYGEPIGLKKGNQLCSTDLLK